MILYRRKEKFHRRCFMNIKRLLAVILAVLALLSFVGCNVKKDTGKEPLNAAGGKADEAMSENQPESTDARGDRKAEQARRKEVKIFPRHRP